MLLVNFVHLLTLLLCSYLPRPPSADACTHGAVNLPGDAHVRPALDAGLHNLHLQPLRVLQGPCRASKRAQSV